MQDFIMDRRSIRKYEAKAVSQEDMRALLECAMLAPSAMNRQPWSFIIIQDRNILNELADKHPYAGMLRQAPACICVCGSEGEVEGYYQQDCAAATMNILTQAKRLGLGTCWMGVAPRKDRMAMVREVLHIPQNINPFNLIAVGYPAEERERPDRWDDSRVHMDRW